MMTFRLVTIVFEVLDVLAGTCRPAYALNAKQIKEITSNVKLGLQETSRRVQNETRKTTF